VNITPDNPKSGRLGAKLSLCGLLLAGFSAAAGAQFKLQQSFEGTTA